MSDDTTPAPSSGSSDNLPAPAPASGTAQPAATDGDNRYKAVQQKLKSLAGALDESTSRLGRLRSRMSSNADRAQTLAAHISDADLDTVFVEMTSAVSTALGGAALELRRLLATAEDLSSLTETTRAGHSKYYSALDEVRTGRKYRTPKPGFFN